MDQNLLDAVKLLRIYTSGSYDPWVLMGNAKATVRQHIMSVLMNGVGGKNVPQKNCGVTALRDELWKRAGIGQGGCLAEREQLFYEWCKSNAPK